MTPLDPGWVTVAVLGRTRGRRGELTAAALTRAERFRELDEVFLFDTGARRGAGGQGGVVGADHPYHIEDAWFQDATLILKFRGVDTISDAERLVGCEVRIPASQRAALEAGEYYQSDLVGCEVFDQRTGQRLGQVLRWEDAGGAGLLVIDGEMMIPFARSICVQIDPENRRIAVNLPEGLKELNRP